MGSESSDLEVFATICRSFRIGDKPQDCQRSGWWRQRFASLETIFQKTQVRQVTGAARSVGGGFGAIGVAMQKGNLTSGGERAAEKSYFLASWPRYFGLPNGFVAGSGSK